MTICFFGCDYKYETEAVMKLFFPLTLFEFSYEEEAEGDRVVVRSDEGRLSVSVCTDGKTEISEGTHERAEAEGFTDEQALCRMLYRILEGMTGVSPKWGCLTGIRPVKKVNALAAEGKSKEEIFTELKRRYYTSEEKLELAYATAITQDKALKRLEDNSYSLYISIPFCPTRCAYCSFVSHSIQSSGAKLIPGYTEKLCEEIALTAEMAEKKGLILDTIYIGGGTPTAISAENIEKIMKKVSECFDISSAAEYTVEAGRADTITEEKLRVIKEYGATRISVNPQSMVDSVLEAAGRRHTAAQVEECFNMARRLGFDNINMDVIAGLPTDTEEGFAYTIDKLIGLDPEDITVHTLTVKRSADLFARSDEVKKSISPSEVDRMVSYSCRRLMESGYMPYYLYRQKNTVGNLENVGYAKKGHESLYNIYIMEEAQTILAAGASGSTKLVNRATGKINRHINYKYPYEYISRFDMMIDKKNAFMNDNT